MAITRRELIQGAAVGGAGLVVGGVVGKVALGDDGGGGGASGLSARHRMLRTSEAWSRRT